jgi:ABC-type sugar transport system ATPase subunit
LAQLELKAITRRYGSAVVLDDVSLSVADGEFLVLVGPSGCGKSTLLRIVAGLVAASSGDVLLDGERVNDLEPRERDVAMVFQNYALYPHMTVRANLAFPLRLAGLPRERVREEVARAAGVLGLESLLDRKPGTLSGGQMQRVALGRAIVRSPRLFLFDEPLSNLDAQLRGQMRAEIAGLHRRLGITTVYVTHDQAEAMTLGSRIAVLEGGRLQQVGAPLEVFQRPATAFVASFIGSPPMNLLEGPVRAGGFELAGFRVPCSLVERPRVVLGFRPHEVRLRRGPGPSGEPGAEVTFVEELGSQTFVYCTLDGRMLVVACEASACAPEVGERVTLEVPEGARHWFDRDGGARLAP